MNKRTFLLPIETLLDILSSQGVSGRVHARLSSLRFKNRTLKDVFLAEIVLLGGNVQSCTVRTQEGALLLQQGEAWDALPAHETEWTLLLSSPSQTGPSTESERAVGSASRVPARRILHPTPAQTGQWTRRHRRVFGLVDGRKTLADIASLLGSSLQEVEKALHDLEPIFIAFTS